MRSYRKNLEELEDALNARTPVYNLRRVHPEYLRCLLGDLLRGAKLAQAEIFDPAAGLMAMTDEPRRLVQRLMPGEDAARFLQDRLSELPLEESADTKPRVLWLRLPDAALEEHPLSSALAATAQRIRMNGCNDRILLSNDIDPDPLLAPFIADLGLSPPRRAEGDEGLDAYLKPMLPSGLQRKDIRTQAARMMQGLDAASICEVTELARTADRPDDAAGRREELLYAAIRAGRDEHLGRSSGLEVIADRVEQDQIGGLEVLKRYLQYQAHVFHRREDAEKSGVDIPRGILLVGLPGCGKSLAAKAAGTIMELPLLRLDVGGLMGRYLGESERNLRDVLSAAEAAAPCVLWVDELEKALGGMAGGEGGGTGKRMLGQLLTWMQEQRAGVYLFATANAVEKLPPELLRRGRFDELFRVDLPDEKERASILDIHLRRRKVLDWKAQDLRAAAQGVLVDFTGSDIECLVREAKLVAFGQYGRASVNLVGLQEAAKDFEPLARQFEGTIKELRDKLKNHGFRNASLMKGKKLRKPPRGSRRRTLPDQLLEVLNTREELQLRVRRGSGFTLQLDAGESRAVLLASGCSHERLNRTVAAVQARLVASGSRLKLTDVQKLPHSEDQELPRLDEKHELFIERGSDGIARMAYTDRRGTSFRERFEQHLNKRIEVSAPPTAILNLLAGRRSLRNIKIVLPGVSTHSGYNLDFTVGKGVTEPGASPFHAVLYKTSKKAHWCHFEVHPHGDGLLLSATHIVDARVKRPETRQALASGLAIRPLGQRPNILRVVTSLSSTETMFLAAKTPAKKSKSVQQKNQRSSSRPKTAARSATRGLTYSWEGHGGPHKLFIAEGRTGVIRGKWFNATWYFGKAEREIPCKAVRTISGWTVKPKARSSGGREIGTFYVDHRKGLLQVRESDVESPAKYTSST